MIEIVVENLGVSKLLPMVESMRERGWVLNQDFSFAYHNATFDNDGYEPVTPKRTVFTFYREEIATVFALIYL